MSLTRTQEIVLDLQLAIDRILEVLDGSRSLSDLEQASEAAREVANAVPHDNGLWPASSQHYIDTGRYFPDLSEYSNAPMLIVYIDGDEVGVACPHAGCAGDAIYEVDEAVRWNSANPSLWEGEPGFGVHQGDGDFETIGWICRTCRRAVELPDGIETEWS